MKTAVFGGGEAAVSTARALVKAGCSTEIISDDIITCDGACVHSANMMRGKYDLIVLTEDADQKDLCWQIGQFLTDDALVLSLQPSFPENELRGYFGSDKIVMGAYDGRLLLQQGDNSAKLAQLLGAEISADVAKNRFEEIAESAFGCVCSLAGCNMSVLASSEAWLELMANIVREFSSVCAAENVYGVTVGGCPIADLITMKGFIKKKYPVKKLIALIPDYSAKTPVNELSCIVSYAKKDGVDVPLCEKMLSSLKAINSGRMKRGPQNLREFS